MYEVQVGAFAHQGHAQVRAWFLQASLTPRQGPDGLSSRVRVGPFPDKAAVQRPEAHARQAPRVARRRAGSGLASRRRPPRTRRLALGRRAAGPGTRVGRARLPWLPQPRPCATPWHSPCKRSR
jgi:hypothetical protein